MKYKNLAISLLLVNLFLWSYQSAAIVKWPLEKFALEALEIVGTAQDQHQAFVLIMANGRLHKIRKGEAIGLNHGVITAINKDSIEIEEHFYEENQPTLPGRLWATKIQKKVIPFGFNTSSFTPDLLDSQIKDTQSPKISFSCKEIDTRALLHALAAGPIEFIISTHVRSKISLHVEDVPLQQAFEIVLYKAGLKYVSISGVNLITTLEDMLRLKNALKPFDTQALPNTQAVVMHFTTIDIRELLNLLSSITEKTAKIDPSIQGKISLAVKNKSWLLLLKLLSKLNDFQWHIDDNEIVIQSNVR